MDQHARLARVLNKLASQTSVQRTRAFEQARAQRHGETRDDGLEAVIIQLESVASNLEKVLRKAA